MCYWAKIKKRKKRSKKIRRFWQIFFDESKSNWRFVADIDFQKFTLFPIFSLLGPGFCSALRVSAAYKPKGERKKGGQRHAWPKGWTDRGGKWVFHHPSAFSSFSIRHVSAHALFRVNATQWYTQGDTKISSNFFCLFYKEINFIIKKNIYI